MFIAICEPDDWIKFYQILFTYVMWILHYVSSVHYFLLGENGCRQNEFSSTSIYLIQLSFVAHAHPYIRVDEYVLGN